MKTLIRTRGFTLIELVVVMSAVAVLVGLVSVNLVTVQDKANLNTTMNTLIADFRTQQLKAMAGDTQGSGLVGRYGLYFEQNGYTLFPGGTYDPQGSRNVFVELPDSVVFEDITLPQSQIIFEIGNGEVVGFSDSQSTLTLTNTSSDEQEVIELNRYGAIVQGP